MIRTVDSNFCSRAGKQPVQQPGTKIAAQLNTVSNTIRQFFRQAEKSQPVPSLTLLAIPNPD